MHPSVENRFYDLLGRKLAGEIQAPELEELESILQQNPELQFFYNQILKEPSEMADVDLDTAYLTHYVKMMYSRKPDKRKTVKRTLVKALIAACSVLIVVLMWQWLKKNKTAPVDQPAIAETGTHKESRSTITLPDGTIVRLNAKSKVDYAEGFGKTTREVFLTGEAYFDVTHNEKLPFIVHTDEADIKVLGTRFNVRNYSNEHRMEAALLAGSIEVSFHKGARHKILLKPSDKIIVKKKVELTRIKVKDSIIIETSWLNDKMAFDDKPFSEIAQDLERQFDVHIEFKNEAVSEYKYTGVYDEDSPEDILKILQMIKPFKYIITDKQITIY